MKPIPEQTRAIDKTASRIGIRAGAGAGKTGVLVERYLRHVLDDDGDPDQILAITFTRKAAAEMKRRIVSRLREAGRFDEARRAQVGPISTVHGYCERLLREYPFDAGLDSKFDVLSEAQAADLVRECARRALGEGLSEAEEALVRQIGGERTYRAPTSEAGAKLLDWVYKVLSEFRTAGRTVAALDALAEASEDVLIALNTYVERRGLEDLGEPFPEGWRTEPALIKTLKSRRPWMNVAIVASKEEHSARLTQGLAELAAKTWRNLLEEFSRLRSLDFAELESRASRLLEERPHVLQGKYRWVIVDEAQDLNPLQYKILSSTPCESLALAGDPQQAIYGFRGADRRLYIEHLETTDRCDLSANFRSMPSIVNAVDEVFSTLWAGEYLAMQPQREEDADPFGQRTELWRVGKFPERQVAQGVVELIGEGVCPSEITVLVPRASRIDDLVGPLRAGGLKIAVLGTGHNYFLRAEIRDLSSALHALSDPLDSLSLLSLLRSPLVGISLDGIVRLGLHAKTAGAPLWKVLDDPPLNEADYRRLAELLEWFVPMAKRADRLPGWQALAEVFAATSLDTRFAMLDGREQLIANAHKLLSLAVERRDLDCARFADWLDSQQRIRSHMGDAESVSPDAEAVRVSTIHSAKGLEWKTVVVQAVDGKRPSPDDLCVVPEEGLLMVRDGDYTPLAFGAALARKDEMEREERRRLLYVAMTRAEDRLCLAVCQDAKDDWYSRIANRLMPKGAALPWVKLRDFRPAAAPAPAPADAQ